MIIPTDGTVFEVQMPMSHKLNGALVRVTQRPRSLYSDDEEDEVEVEPEFDVILEPGFEDYWNIPKFVLPAHCLVERNAQVAIPPTQPKQKGNK